VVSIVAFYKSLPGKPLGELGAPLLLSILCATLAWV
jgi:hypothetical protein